MVFAAPEKEEPMKKAISLAGKAFIYYALIPFVGCAVGILVMMGIFDVLVVPLLTAVVYVILHRKMEVDMKTAALINLWSFAFVTAVFAVLMIAARGDFYGAVRKIFVPVCFPFIFANSFFDLFVVTVFATYAVATATCAICARKEIKFKWAAIPLMIAAAALVAGVLSYAHRPSVRYAGHGFDYMNGYSTTDFTDYTVYAKNSKLVSPDTDPGFMIEDEDEMPVLDGAEACYPLYSSFAKAVYKDIDKIERDFIKNEPDSPVNGKIVTFTNTVRGFERLAEGEADLFFGARPSADQMNYARECGVEPEITPIGKEAFVFFVHPDKITLPQMSEVRFNGENFLRRVFLGVDYYLLLTFIALFILIGNLQNIEFFTRIFERWIIGNEVMWGILASQVISNVPAAMLLSGFSTNYEAIIVGINIGGLGTLIASMANLISFKILVREYNEFKIRYLVVFTVLNVILVSILIVVYMVC